MTRLPNPQLALQWRERLDRFDQSELTVAGFCEQEGCSTASFYQWRRRLRDAGKRPWQPGLMGRVGWLVSSDSRRRNRCRESLILNCAAGGVS